MINFNNDSLENLCRLITDGSHNSPKSKDEGFFMASVKDMGEYDFNFSECRMISSKDYEKLVKLGCSPKKGDLLISKDGSPLSNLFIFNGKTPLVILSSIAIVRTNEKILLPEYLMYYLKNEPIKNHICSAYTTGSVIPRIILNDFKKFIVYYPNLENQKKIVSTLNSLDEKIQLNSTINLSLEKITKMMFDYWFLQFDFPNNENKPYKTSGGEMIFNEELNREIPQDWSVGNLNDIAQYINGLACQNHRPISDDKKLPVIKITEMHDGFTDKTEFVRNDINDKHIILDGDILFSWSATLETMIWTGGKGGLNQHIFKVIPKDYGKYYVYQQLSSYIINFVRMAESRKTTMGHITKDHLLQSKIPLPPKELTYKFNDLVSDFYDKFILNNQKNRELTDLKEFLLPLLLSGQVSFKD